jgi:hypothetical protein
MRLALALLCTLIATPAMAGEGSPGFADRPAVGHQLRFTDAAGHIFRPERLVILGPAGARAASLPATSDARSEQHVDLSGLPLIGHLFRDRLAPGDVRRAGTYVGPLTRHGAMLVLDAGAAAPSLESRAIALTANLPRHGAVSYWLAPRRFAPAPSPAGPGRRAGGAWLVGDLLVLAGPGRDPLIDDWGQFFEGLPR